MILTNFTMLGTTAPEVQTDGRRFVCSAGIDPSVGLIRIYPLAEEGAPNRWSLNTIELTRNPRDQRHESFQIDGDRDPDNHAAINRMFTTIGTTKQSELASMIDKHTVTSIDELNKKRRSLAFVPLPAGTGRIHWRENQAHPDHPQEKLDLGIPGEGTVGNRTESRAFTPILNFQLEDGEHNLTIRDRGAFEYIRKGNDRDQLSGALHLERDRLLLIGNHNRFRNSWLVISVMSPVEEVAGLTHNQLSLVSA